MIHTPAYTMRPFTEDDLPTLQYMMRAVFNQKLSIEYLRKKYDTRWAGATNLAWIALHDGQPASFYGVLAQRFRLGDRLLLAAHNCDSMTMPAFKGQGLYRDLGLMVYERLKDQGLSFIAGFHSAASYNSLRKLNWLEGPHMVGYWLETGLPGWGRLRQKLLGVRFPHAWQRISLADGMPNSHLGREGMHLDYCPAFFHYKSFTPNGVISIGKALFWVKAGSVLMVGDAWANTDAELAEGIAILKKMAGKEGYGRILFQVHPASQLQRVLPKLAEGFESWLIGYYPLSEKLDVNLLRTNFGDLDTF